MPPNLRTVYNIIIVLSIKIRVTSSSGTNTTAIRIKDRISLKEYMGLEVVRKGSSRINSIAISTSPEHTIRYNDGLRPAIYGLQRATSF